MKDTMKEESMNRVLSLLTLGKQRIPERCTLRHPRQSIPAEAAALRKFEGPDPLTPEDENTRTPHRACSGRLHSPQPRQASGATDPRRDN